MSFLSHYSTQVRQFPTRPVNAVSGRRTVQYGKQGILVLLQIVLARSCSWLAQDGPFNPSASVPADQRVREIYPCSQEAIDSNFPNSSTGTQNRQSPVSLS